MRTVLTLLASTVLLATACDSGSSTTTAPVSRTTAAGQAPQAVRSAEPAPPLADPDANTTLYVCWIKDPQGQLVMGARTMLLNAVPDPEYMSEPVRKNVVNTYKSPAHGRVNYAVVSDGKPYWLWVGGIGFEPSVTALEPAIGGKRYERDIQVQILPVATLVILDHEGNRCKQAMLTIKKSPEEPNLGNTWRADDSGELKYTARPGTFILEASKDNGTSYMKMSWEWSGDPKPIEIRLPEKSIRN